LPLEGWLRCGHLSAASLLLRGNGAVHCNVSAAQGSLVYWRVIACQLAPPSPPSLSHNVETYLLLAHRI
jgi:hypothetical protein